MRIVVSASDYEALKRERDKWEDTAHKTAETLAEHTLKVAELAKQLAEARERVKLLEHKIITCGVAASHPDPELSRRKSDYGGPWDSPQAEEVRKLREQLAEANRKIAKFIHGEETGGCEHGIQDGEYCKPCGDEYKRARIANGDADPEDPGQTGLTGTYD